MRIALAAALVLGLVACGRSKSTVQKKPLPPDQADTILHERVWLDHVPRGMNEKFVVTFFDESGGGITMNRTVWKGQFELFMHEAHRGELELVLPASGTEMTTAFHITPYDGPEEADMKLVIDHPPFGPREYFGFDVGGHGDATVDAIDGWVRARFSNRPR